MHSTRLKELLQSTELLSSKIRKNKARVSLNNFIDERINGTQHAVQPLTQDVSLSSVQQIISREASHRQEELKTEIDDQGVITTQEMCYIPFPFVQSETVSFKDGRRVVTVYYPDYKKLPVKIIDYSSDKRTITTTTFDRNGNKKMTVINIVESDGTRIEENVDHLHSTKEVKKFNRMNIAVEITSYVDDRLSFQLKNDEFGQMISEKTYFSSAQKPTLMRESVRISAKQCVIKEYSFDGKVVSTKTVLR